MKTIKWFAVAVAGLIVIVLAALLVVPMLVDMGKYKPMIERRVSDTLGLPFSIKGDLRLSFFPWAGVALKDLRLGNPPGFEGDDLLAIKSLEVKVKLIPLLSRDLQVKRFQVDGPRVVLQKSRDGRTNWGAIGRTAAGASAGPEKDKKSQSGTADAFPIRSLVADEMTVRGGSLLFLDRAAGGQREIKDIDLKVKDASLDRPISFLLTSLVDGNNLRAQGTLGPLGQDPMKGSVPLGITLKAFKEVSVDLKGKIRELGSNPKFELALDVASFSPRRLMNALAKESSLTTSDPKALGLASLRCDLKGSSANMVISDGTLKLDDSVVRFTSNIKDFSKPEMSFNVNLDQMDLDRYLPPPQEKGSGKSTEKSQPGEKKKSDYSSFRTVILDGEIRAGKIKVKGVQIQDVSSKVHGRDGVLRLDPFNFTAYQGTLRSKAEVDLRTDSPRTSVEMETAGVKIRPLLNALMKKDFLDGTAESRLELKMEGDASDAMMKSLNGSGNLRVRDGAIIGIDLPEMARNVQSAFGLSEKSSERPKTDFSELNVPFTVKDGIARIQGAFLAAPLLRAEAAGTADLPRETLYIHLEPKVVATIKGQGDSKGRSGFGVPVIVTGTFASPKFAPDLEGMVKKGLPTPSELEGMIKGKDSKQPGARSPEDALKGILKRFGR